MDEEVIEAVFTADEVAKMMRLSPYTIQKACLRGEFPGAYRTGTVGGQWRIPRSALSKYREFRVNRTFPNPEFGIAPYRRADRRAKRLI